jgi:uncharacterized membrane protein SpoIIM required for sporulation
MALAPALRAAAAALRSHTSDLLPAFFLMPAAAAVARVLVVAGAGISAAYLAATGRLARVSSEVRGSDLEPPEAGADPAATAETFESLAPALEPLFPPAVVGTLLVAGLLSVATFLASYAVATAARLSACRAALADRNGIIAGIDGAERHWRAMALLVVFEAVLWALLTAVAVGVVALSALVSPLAGLVFGLLVALLWSAAVLSVRAVFAFAVVAVVVDDAGGAEALSAATAFLRTNTVDAVWYYLLSVGVFGLAGALAGATGSAAGPTFGVVSFLVVSPVLALTKTALYAAGGDQLSPPATPESTLYEQVRRGLGRGLGEMRGFVREAPGLHALSLGLLLGGFLVGWTVAAPLEGAVTASIENRLEGQFPPSAAAAFATNNWSVAVSTALSGVAVGVPAAVSVLFNGVVLGVAGRLETAPLELVAFVAPHGLVEIPAVVIAGALGLSLGRSVWRTVRGAGTRKALAADLESAFWVLVGAAALLVVAALIEGFVSPFYYRPFL